MQKVENFLTTTGSSKRGAFSICLLVALLQNYNRVMVLTDLKKEFMTDKASFRAIIEQWPTVKCYNIKRFLQFSASTKPHDKTLICYCRSLKKVKFSTDQFRPALGSGCCLIVTMLKKPQNCPISDFFDLTPKYFLPLLPYTDLVPPSTDPVPPSTNQYRPILTQYHHVSTITTLCWSSTTKY